MRALSLAHTPDSDDAFMFHALLQGMVRTPDLEFRSSVAEIESLNQDAGRERYDVTALSLHGYAYVSDRYVVLPSGAAVGDGYGPVVVAREPTTPRDLAGRLVAVPGQRTTAALLLRLWIPEIRTISVPFDQVPGAVAAGDADAGVLIHEGQLIFSRWGLHHVMDLGQWWRDETGLPLVLGVVAARRGLGRDILGRVAEAVRASVAWALQNRKEAMAAAERYGRGMEGTLLERFVSMYVHESALDLAPRAVESASLLLRLAAERGLIPARVRFEVFSQAES